MRLVELGSVCQIRNGYAFKSSEFKESGTPLIRISNFDDGPVFFDDKTVYVESSYLKTKSGFKVEKGDVLIALSGATTGKYGIYTNEEPSLLNQRIGLLKSGTSQEISDKFFYHYLAVLKSEILRKAGGAAQPNISTKVISDFKIPLPPLEEQKKIAAILDAADDYKQKTKALIDKYDQLTQSLFLDMFGDPVTNPMGWDKLKIEEVSTIVSGNTPKGIDRQFSLNGTIPFFRVSDMNHSENTMYMNYSKNLLSPEQIIALKLKPCPKGTIIFPKRGASIFTNKKRVLNKQSVFDLNTMGLIPKTNIKAKFFFSWFSQFNLSSLADGSSVPQLNNKQIKPLNVIFPPSELQHQFAERVAQIEKQKQQAEASLVKAEELFNSLLQKAFKGELTN